MTKTRWLILAIAVVAVAAAVLLTDRFQPPPTYEGRTVAEWMMESLKTYPHKNPNALYALRTMGEPAVAELARMVEDEDSKLKRQLVLLSVKLPALQQFVSSSHWYRYYAAKTLAELGADAKSAIPVLEKMASCSDKDLRRVATAALIRVRVEPIENYITAYLNYIHGHGTNSSESFGLLLELGPAAKIGVPVLLRELQTTNARIRLSVLLVLRNVGCESAECVAPLVDLLFSTNSTLQTSAMGGLAHFGPLIQPVVPTIVSFISDENPSLRSSTLRCLWSAASKEDLIPFRAVIENATNDLDPTAKIYAEMILNEKLNQP
jgi:HEAT repeat protein